MFKITFKDKDGYKKERLYSSNNTIEEIQKEFNEYCRLYDEVNVFEVEEFNITSTMLNPKERFTPVKEKIERIRQMLIYFRNLAMEYNLNLVKGKPENDMARIREESEASLMMLNDVSPRFAVWESDDDKF